MNVNTADSREHPFKDKIVLNLAFNHCFLPLRSILSTYFNVIIIFRYNNIGRNIIRNNVKTKNELGTSGIYSIECGRCPAIYWGQSANLANRISQHIRDVTNDNESSLLVRHQHLTKHRVDLNSFCHLYKVSNHFSRSIIESALIFSSYSKNMNHRQGDTRMDEYISQRIAESILKKETRVNFIWNFV